MTKRLVFGRHRHSSIAARTVEREPPPLATILICNHNYGRYLAASIESAIGQTYPRLEIIVVDDGSTDESREILRRYSGRIRTVLKDNGGQPSAVNVGFGASRGEYVCFLDSDDVFAPGKVARLIDLFERNPDIGWIFHELDYISESNRPISIESLADPDDVQSILRRRARYAEFTSLDFRTAFANGMRLPYACPAFSGLSFRRQTLEVILPMPEDIAKASDEFPKIAAIALFPGAHLGEPLAQQRIHGNNASSFRGDAPIAAATRYLKTAYHLRHRFNHIGRSTDKWFASSFGRLLGAAGARAALEPVESRRYLRRYFGPITWVRQGPRIAVHAARARWTRLHPAASNGRR